LIGRCWKIGEGLVDWRGRVEKNGYKDGETRRIEDGHKIVEGDSGLEELEEGHGTEDEEGG